MAEIFSNPDQSEAKVFDPQEQDLPLQKTIVHKYAPSTDGAFRQGEILTNLRQFKLNIASLRSDKPSVEPVIHPFAILITQDCDCEQDYRPRKEGTVSNSTIPSLLFCEVVDAESLRNRDKGNTTVDINSAVWGQVKVNKNERYHFLEAVPNVSDALGEGVPELALDFKRYFTIPTEEVYYRIEIGEARRRCRLISPYLEHLTSRFNYFQSRVALPEDHTSI